MEDVLFFICLFKSVDILYLLHFCLRFSEGHSRQPSMRFEEPVSSFMTSYLANGIDLRMANSSKSSDTAVSSKAGSHGQDHSG